MQRAAAQRISVVIPTYNRAALLSRTLALYCEQSYPSDRYDIIVVDDGSTDQTEAAVGRHIGNVPYDLKYVRVDHAGPSAARNKGIQLADGDRILFTNDDIFPERDLLEQHARMAALHPDAAILGFVAWSPEIEVSAFMRFVSPAGAQFDYSDIADPLDCGYRKFFGANISIPLHWIRNERFDEKISTATVEDHEFGYRLEKRGLKVVFNPDAIGYHHHPLAHASFLCRMEEAGKAIRYVWDVHPELEKTLRPFRYVPMGLLQSTADALSPACRLVNRKMFWQLTMMSRYLKGIRTARSPHRVRQEGGA